MNSLSAEAHADISNKLNSSGLQSLADDTQICARNIWKAILHLYPAYCCASNASSVS